jgi:hypothetical protein
VLRDGSPLLAGRAFLTSDDDGDLTLYADFREPWSSE